MCRLLVPRVPLADLVPREVGERWLKYFREELPTVAFKCSTQTQSTGLKQQRMPSAKSLTDTLTVSGGCGRGRGAASACSWRREAALRRPPASSRPEAQGRKKAGAERRCGSGWLGVRSAGCAASAAVT